MLTVVVDSTKCDACCLMGYSCTTNKSGFVYSSYQKHKNKFYWEIKYLIFVCKLFPRLQLDNLCRIYTLYARNCFSPADILVLPIYFWTSWVIGSVDRLVAQYWIGITYHDSLDVQHIRKITRWQNTYPTCMDIHSQSVVFNYMFSSNAYPSCLHNKIDFIKPPSNSLCHLTKNITY